MKITICIGSCCHKKGARLVLNELQKLISEHSLKDRIDILGEFGMKDCENLPGVAVSINGKIFSVSQDQTQDFFNKEVLKRLK